MRAIGLPDVFAAQDVRYFVTAGALTPTDGSRLIELYTLSVDDTIVATMGGVCADGRFSAMFSSIVHGRFGTESPGEQLLVRVVRDCCERGLHTFDLGVGEASYKSLFCDADPMFDSYWPLSARGQAFAAARRGFAAAKRAVKQNPVLWKVIVTARRIKARLMKVDKAG
jgi:CelD/BcsL family acetyltransferase involved in cellulose biosynthesis